MSEIDVIGQRDIVIPQLEGLVRLDIKNFGRYHEMQCRGEISAHEQSERAYRELVQASEDLVVQVWGRLSSGGADHNLLYRSRGYEGRNVRLEDHNVLSNSEDTTLVGCVVYGWNPLSHSIRPTVRDSFVLGHNTINGLSPDPSSGHVDRAIRTYSGDTYHVDISNSVVFGWNAGDHIKGGTIRDSIFAGYGPLSKANVRVWNLYIITRDGTKYIKDGILGRPEDYEEIPTYLLTQIR